MRTRPECLPCSLRQIVTIADRVTRDDDLRMDLLRRGMRYLGEASPERTPAELSTDLFHLVAEALGSPDPYGPEKERYNREAMALYPVLRKTIADSADPLHTAVLVSVAGNLIDLGILAPVAVEEAVAGILKKGLARNDLAALREDLARAESLLFVGDNAGEIAFDRLLVEEIRREYPAVAVTFAVKSGPCMNDATRADAEAVGMGEIAAVIETGGAHLGAPRAGLSPAFREAFRRAGAVIAKGHANYETLDEQPRPALYFLLTVKCAVVAAALGVREGDSVLAGAAAR
ncbi:MAG: damage-control phosphatase ARMT1 family protein [Patescibacteria group bacterium]